MLVGIPGSGKDTWLRKQKAGRKNFAVISIDDMRKELTSDVSNQACNSIVWSAAKTQAKTVLYMGRNVILNATNVNTAYRKDFLSGLPPCRKLARVFPVKPETAYGRIRKDLDRGIDRSRVPEETVYRMYGEFLYTVRNLQQEGFRIIRELPEK